MFTRKPCRDGASARPARPAALAWCAALLAAMVCVGPFTAYAADATATGGTDTLQAAIDTANDGDTVTLADDITLTRQVTVSKGVTIDLNGHVLRFTPNENDATVAGGESDATPTALVVTATQPVTVRNGTMLGAGGGRWNGRDTTGNGASRALYAAQGSDLSVQGVTFGQFGVAKVSRRGGGAAIKAWKATLSVKDSVFGGEDAAMTNTSASGGAGIYAYASQLTVQGSRFERTYSAYGTPQTDIPYAGGAIVAEDDLANPSPYSFKEAMKGSGATLDVSDSVFRDNYSADGGGALLAWAITKVRVDGNEFTGNHAFVRSGVASRGGALRLVFGDESTVENNTFDSNVSESDGGAFFVSTAASSAVVRDNRFTGNSATAVPRNGGAVYAEVNEDTTLELADNVFTGNSAYRGGAVTLSQTAPGTAVLDGNTMDGNTAISRGGALSSRSWTTAATIQIKSGTFTDNKAGDFGGAIDYTGVTSPTLELWNALITGNTAVRGGGVWACPSSQTEMYATFGGAIYGNTATGVIPSPGAVNVRMLDGSTQRVDVPTLQASGDDIQYENADDTDDVLMKYGQQDGSTVEKDPGYHAQSKATVLERSLGGAAATWYRDVAGARYSDGDEPIDASDYRDARRSFGLHAELDDIGERLAASEASLVFTGNSAARGGAIATNTTVLFGLPTGEDTTLNITKAWGDDVEQHPASVSVDLYRVDEQGGETLLQKDLAIDGEHGWTLSVEHLPSAYLDADGGRHRYTYRVDEHEPGYVASYETLSEDDGARTVQTITITNHPDPNAPDPGTPGDPGQPGQPGAPEQPTKPADAASNAGSGQPGTKRLAASGSASAGMALAAALCLAGAVAVSAVSAATTRRRRSSLPGPARHGRLTR